MIFILTFDFDDYNDYVMKFGVVQILVVVEMLFSLHLVDKLVYPTDGDWWYSLKARRERCYKPT